MRDAGVNLVIDGEDAKARAAIKNVDQDLDDVGRSATAATNAGAAGANKMKQAWGALNKEVSLSEDLFRANFSAEQIGGALNAISGDVGKLAGSIGNLNDEASEYAGNLASIGITTATNNPWAAAATASQALARNLAAVVKELKNIQEAEKKVNLVKGEKGKLGLFVEAAGEAYGVTGPGHLATGAADQGEVQKGIDKMQQERAAAAAKRAAQEKQIEQALVSQLMQLRLSATDFAIWQAERDLENFKGTGTQYVVAYEITQEKIKQARERAAAQEKAMREKAAAEEKARQEKLLAEEKKRQAERMKLRLKALAEAKTAGKEEARREQQALRDGLARRRDAAAQAQENINIAREKEAAARRRALMNPADLARLDQRERRELKDQDRENKRINRLVDQAKARQERGAHLTRRQRAALAFAEARDARQQAEADAKKQAQNIAKIEANLAKVAARLEKIVGA